MGPFVDEENLRGSWRKNLSVDINEMAAQRIDGDTARDVGHDESLYYSDTMLVDDACSVDDSFETQLVDPGGETQLVGLAGETQVVDVEGEIQLRDLEDETRWANLAGQTQLVDVEGEIQLADLEGETQWVDLAGETQLVDLVGETQVVDDLDCVKSMQFLDDIDTTKSMEHTCEMQVLSQDGSDNIDGCPPVKLKDTTDNHPPKQGVSACRTPSDAVMNAEHHSGKHLSRSVSKGFTSIRAASIRASGLAASALGTNANLCLSDNASIEQPRYNQDNSSLLGTLLESGRQLWNKNSDNNEKLKYSKKSRPGSTAMRKLFGEDDDAELVQSGDDADYADDNPNMPELPTSGNCLAGLSYTDSQEPGELSQAHALEVVDRFLDLNTVELEEDFDTKVRNSVKLNGISGRKGSLNLAKRSILKSTDGEYGIYNWDNTREDDGGGDFFRKKKELFFNKGSTEPRKGRHRDAGSVEPGGNNGNKKEQCTKKKLGGTVYSDSRLMQHKGRAKGKFLDCGDEVLHNSIEQNLDEQLNRVSGLESAENDTFKDVPDVMNIGPDTQMAAEAMETLCFEVQLDDNNNDVPNKDTLGPAKGTNRKIGVSAPLEEQLTTKTLYSAKAGVTRHTKQKERVSLGVGNESALSPNQSKKIRKKHDTELDMDKQMKLAGMESTHQKSAVTNHLKEQLDFTIPVAKRTRKCRELNCPTTPTNSFDPREEMNDLMSSHVLRKKRTTSNRKNAKIITIDQLKRIRLAAFNQAKKVSIGTVSDMNIDAVGNGQGKRSQKEMLAVGHEVDTRSGNFKRPKVAQEGYAEKSAEGAKTNGRLKASPSTSACRTPATRVAPVNEASPICIGDEYHKQSYRKSLSKLSLIKEINDLATASPGLCGGTKELRKRKDITRIKVLFSQHLDEDVVKQQKKILSRLGGAVAPSMSEATHFVADEFVRTRNMLEAIACGKPVVTHLWLESCGQANCLIDEKNYILRDAKKEKEFGFCLPVSLSRACQRPLLQRQKVFITPNTKPGKDILANLVKAVSGLPIERLGRSILNDEKLPDDLLILSCEEDYDNCVPFLEKGGSVYSSELLLNGIVKQKLEHERHVLFEDHVKRTRSTIWVKKKNQYHPVTKCK